VTGVQIAVTVSETFGSPANPAANQPVRLEAGALSNTVAKRGLLVVAPPPTTFMPLGQLAVVEVPAGCSATGALQRRRN